MWTSIEAIQAEVEYRREENARIAHLIQVGRRIRSDRAKQRDAARRREEVRMREPNVASGAAGSGDAASRAAASRAAASRAAGSGAARSGRTAEPHKAPGHGRLEPEVNAGAAKQRVGVLPAQRDNRDSRAHAQR